MDRLPDRGRVTRVAVEARITNVESKAAKATRSHSKPPVKPARMKVIWEVCSGTGRIVKTFPYPDKAAAEAQTKALTRSTGRAHMLRSTKVPME